MFKKISIFSILSVIFFTGCASKTPELDLRCFKNGEVAPNWICDGSVDGYYSGLGIATIKENSYIEFIDNDEQKMKTLHSIAIKNAKKDLVNMLEVLKSIKIENLSIVKSYDIKPKKAPKLSPLSIKKIYASSSKAKVWVSKEGDYYVLYSAKVKEIDEILQDTTLSK
ncbi:MAG: hypothetical protein U9P72_07610 [Campylobacterota bacterium]|nr:hypothetical protein [Campylobacterota bacterium]